MKHQSQRGFTLIELMVATVIGLFIVSGTFVFMVHQNRLLNFTKNEVDRDRTGRMAIDLLAQDLRHAGLGVGYAADGQFNGLRLGSFTVPGGAVFNSRNHAVTLTRSDNGLDSSFGFVTDDVGIRFANGSYRSVVSYAPNVLQVCAGGAFEVGDVVVLQVEGALQAMTAKLTSVSGANACTDGSCVAGCQTIGWQTDASFRTSPTALTADYAGGEMAGKYREVVWFVDDGTLRRAEISASEPCAARNETCGVAAGFNVETLQMRVLQWDADANAWEDKTADAALSDARRIRVDLEMVVRTRGAQNSVKNTVGLQLEAGQCLPDCVQADTVARRPLRTSVEIRNSGRLRLAGGSI